MPVIGKNREGCLGELLVFGFQDDLFEKGLVSVGPAGGGEDGEVTFTLEAEEARRDLTGY